MHTQTRCPPFVVIVCTGWKKRHARQTTNDTSKRRVRARTHRIRTHYVILPSRSDAILNWRTCTHVDTVCTDPTSFMIGQFEKSHVTRVSSTRAPTIGKEGERESFSASRPPLEHVLSAVKFSNIILLNETITLLTRRVTGYRGRDKYYRAVTSVTSVPHHKTPAE